MSAASEVTGWRELPGSVRRALWNEFFRQDLGTLDGEAMGATIHALRAQLTRMAFPVCGTVNPPEVHTCTPRPRVTVVLSEWAIVNKNNWIVERIRGDGSSNNGYRERYDFAKPHDAPHTVKRVALIDTDTGEAKGDRQH